MMRKFRLMTMRASGYIRGIKFPMGSSLGSPGFGMSSFRKWHFFSSIIFYLLFYFLLTSYVLLLTLFLVLSPQFQILQLLPARID